MESNEFSKYMSDPNAVDPYSILGLESQADEAEIKRAYFRKVREFPPEREPQKFQEIRRAYEKLKDDEFRSLLNLFRIQAPLTVPNRRRPAYDLSVHTEDLLRFALSVQDISMEDDFRNIEN